jgi:hypothetical protein
MKDYSTLTKEQMRANENWFTNVLNTLQEGGRYAFPDAMEIYVKRGNKLICTKGGFDAVVGLVRKEYLEKNFKIEEGGA